MKEKLLGWMQETPSMQHCPCCNHPWVGWGGRRGAAVWFWLAEVVHQVVGLASMPGSDVLLPWQLAKLPFLRRAQVEC